MKVEVNFKKRYSYFLVGFVILFGGIFLISAYASPVTGVGHDPSEFDWSQTISSVQVTSLTLNGDTESSWPTATPASPETPGLAGLSVQQVVPNQGSAQEGSMCVLLDTGQVKCSGYNTYGQLGVGDNLNRSKFELVPGLSGVTKLVSTGRLNYCAILNTGNLKCWGYNGFGQLGIGSAVDSNYPQTVIDTNNVPLANVVDVQGQVSGYNYEYTCALTSAATGNLYCWGYNGHGQVGVGDTNSRAKATKLTSFNLVSVKNFSLAGYNSGGSVCAIVGDAREVYCWGYNGYGQLGMGDTTTRWAPAKISGLSDVKVLESSHTDMATFCAIVGNSREVYCWGYNGYGQVGVGDTTNRNVPTSISLSGVEKLKAIGAGLENSFCALKSDGSLYCWGYNGHGQVGVGDTTSNKYSPNLVSTISDVKDIAGWGYGLYGHYCAIVGDAREVYCWGYSGHSQVGQGSNPPTYYETLPKRVIGLEGLVVESLVCGGNADYNSFTNGNGGICAVILDDASVRTWGDNWFGQLGDGTLGEYDEYGRPIGNNDELIATSPL